MQVVNDKLHLKLRNPTKVTAAVPNAKEIQPHHVEVNWGVEESQYLNNIGIEVPSPIMGLYKWSGRLTPFAHQKDTAAFFTLNRRAFCFNEQGTGKTASAIWASDYLMNEGLANRVLVVCPLSIMDSAWRNDLFTFAMHRSVDVAHGAAAKRKKIINNGADYVVINYDGIRVVADEIENGGFDLIIIDEATHYKNAQTDRWKTMNKLVKPDTWLWMMTGTPAAQSPLDAYGIAKLMNKDSVPRAFGSFRDQLMYKVTQFKWVPKENAKDRVYEVLQPAIRYTKAQCLDLPDMVYVTRDADMTRQQAKYYQDLKSRFISEAAGETISAVNAAQNMNKLLQLSSGAIYTDSGEALEFDVKHRYKAVREVIDETDHKVLIFVPYKHAIQVVAQKLRKDGFATEVISGDVPASKRTAIFDDFQTTDSPRVLVLQPATAAHGVTLTRADTVVWWGPTSSLETYLQANARVHR
ncbi:MAG TPA: DEAD/DEAH box helicase, partial [Candidatus Paceibacterota bacterium]|nr:DEAD/DEAH box helicase [Candidatus Paceibacterota bacterium]